MATNARYGLKGKGRDSYLELVQAFPLSTIKSDDHLKDAQTVIDEMLAQGRLDVGAAMYLDALSELVACYEDKHYAIAPASDADMLQYFMDSKGVSQAQLSRDAGIAKSTVSEILACKNPFSKQIIRKLAEYFGVDVSVLSANL